jgi:hypothetical protein
MRLPLVGLILGVAALGACGSQRLGLPSGPQGGAGRGGGSGLTGIGGRSSVTGGGGATAPSGDGGSSATGTGAVGGWTDTGPGATGGAGQATSTCAQLDAEYVSAIRTAQKCALGVPNQCQQTISAHLPVCDSCSTAINSVTNDLTVLRGLWLLDGCDSASGPCTDAGVCNIPTNTVCADTGDGTGKCSFVVSVPPHGDAGTASTGYCTDLIAQYGAALPAAQRCGTSAQCGSFVASALSPCPVCGTYVSDPSALNALRHQWLQASCQNTILETCIDSGPCPPAAVASCVGADAGQGSCMTTTSGGAPLSD